MTRQHYALAAAIGCHSRPFANRQPLPLHADTANFESYADRVTLSLLGIFSVDSTAHRAKRAAQAADLEMIEAAYRTCGLNRTREHDKIAAEMERTKTDGIWAKSTGAWEAQCDALDREIVDLVYTGGYHA